MLGAQNSDHRPIFLSLDNSSSKQMKGSKGFKYEAIWALEKECEQVIDRESKMRIKEREHVKRVQELMSMYKSALTKWNRRVTMSKAKKILYSYNNYNK